jgi:hypothetical protein
MVIVYECVAGVCSICVCYMFARFWQSGPTPVLSGGGLRCMVLNACAAIVLPPPPGAPGTRSTRLCRRGASWRAWAAWQQEGCLHSCSSSTTAGRWGPYATVGPAIASNRFWNQVFLSLACCHVIRRIDHGQQMPTLLLFELLSRLVGSLVSACAKCCVRCILAGLRAFETSFRCFLESAG